MSLKEQPLEILQWDFFLQVTISPFPSATQPSQHPQIIDKTKKSKQFINSNRNSKQI